MRKFLKICLVLFLMVNIITAFHAYKFTHFYDRTESNLKSLEDHSGWNKARALLFGINALKQKINSTPDTVFQTVYLKSSTFPKLEAWYIPVKNPKGSICLFHGHGGTKSGVINEAIALRKMGYSTFLVDFRAHGNSEGNTCTIGFDESEEVKLAYDFMKGKGENNIILWGISMGAASISKAVNDYSIQPEKIILEMPFGSILEAAESRIKLMGLPAEPIATLVTFWGGVEHGFWAFNMKPSEYVKKIQCPVLIQWGKNDIRVTSHEINEIHNNITSAKQLVVYENAGHESLYKAEPAKWIAEVNSFLK